NTSSKRDWSSDVCSSDLFAISHDGKTASIFHFQLYNGPIGANIGYFYKKRRRRSESGKDHGTDQTSEQGNKSGWQKSKKLSFCLNVKQPDKGFFFWPLSVKHDLSYAFFP